MRRHLFFKIRKCDNIFKDENAVKELLSKMNDNNFVAKQVDLILETLDIENIKRCINKNFRTIPGYIEYQNTFYLYNSSTKKSDTLEVFPNRIFLILRNPQNLFYDFLKSEFPELIIIELKNREY